MSDKERSVEARVFYGFTKVFNDTMYWWFRSDGDKPYNLGPYDTKEIAIERYEYYREWKDNYIKNDKL